MAMSTDTEFRFPTYREVAGEGYAIPILPRHEIFETVRVGNVGPLEAEKIMAREPWSFDAANLRVLDAMLDDGWAMHPYGMLVPPDRLTRDDPDRPGRLAPKDRTKSGPTPRRKDREPGMRGSEGGCYS
jgi:hypothetical protein